MRPMNWNLRGSPIHAAPTELGRVFGVAVTINMALLTELDRFCSGASGQYRAHTLPGCRGHHPGGMAENSPAFQRRDFRERVSSPEGTAETDGVGRPFGTNTLDGGLLPNVETLGYFHSSLRDRENLACLNE